MATKKAKEVKLGDGILVYGPDGKLYFVSFDDPRVPVTIDLSEDCMKAFSNIGSCLRAYGFKSNKVVLSGVMTKANGIAPTRRPVGRRSAKK